MHKGLEPSDSFKEKMKKHGKMTASNNKTDKSKSKGRIKPSKLFGKKNESD